MRAVFALTALLASNAVASDVPPIGAEGALDAGTAVAAPPLGPADNALYEEMAPWADKLVQAEGERAARYDAYRASPGEAADRGLEAAIRGCDYYAQVWRSIVEPALDFAGSDPRVSPMLRVLSRRLAPLSERLAALKAGQAAAARALKDARDAARAQAARLYEDDRKAVEEFALTGGGFAAVQAAVPEDRRASEEYMRWVRSAFSATVKWARAVKVSESWEEERELVEGEYVSGAGLVQALVAKKLAHPFRAGAVVIVNP
ncbi:MAG: hypothetical protein HY928_14755 [Elusimicrobia bacterium]|nr:hypothetical protein [Elusimicrobiota bacterium]